MLHLLMALVSGVLVPSPPAPEVSGIVLDPSGTAVAGARVTLRRPSGAPLVAATDLGGGFRFTGLAPGQYEVRVEHEGFKRFDARVSPGARLRVVLRLAELRERATVREPDEVSAEPGANMDIVKLDRKALDKLPVLGNDVVGSAAEFLDSAAIGAGGVSIVVDGMETSEKGVSASAIQEIRINQDPYSAEYARPGRGRLEIITKAGQQEYHGSATFLFRDHRLEARNAFAGSRPPEQRRIFEGHFTGPLGNGKRSSFLISGNHEEEDLQRLVFAQTPAGVLREHSANPKRQTEFSAKVTRQLGASHTVSVRYEFGDDRGQGEDVGGFTLPEAGSDYAEREQHVYYNDRAVLTPGLTNDFSLRLGRHSFVNRSRLPGVRQIVVVDAFTGGGAQNDRHTTENHVQFTDMMSWVRGRHLVKFGVSVPEINRRAAHDWTNSDGAFTFSSLDDYAAGRPFSFAAQQGDRYLAFWQEGIGLFVQDDVKLRPNLSLAAGLRWDWQNHFPDRNNLAPRLSVAFSPDKKRRTVLRAGAGLFYERTGPAAVADVLRFDGRHLRPVLLSNPGYPDPLSRGGTLDTQPAGITRFASRVRSPYLLQYSAGMERQIRKRLSATATYTGTVGVKLFRSRDVNAPPPPLYAYRPLTEIGILREIETAGRLRTHSLDFGLRGSPAEWFTGTVLYGLGRSWNNTGGIGAFPANSYDLSGEWARANFDVRHRFRVLGTFHAGGLFDLGTMLLLSTGPPYSITTGRDGNHDGRASDRPPGVARNTMQGFGTAGLDVRLSRELKLRRGKDDEGPGLELSADAFNALNRVNYTNVVGTLTSPFFGQPVASRAARRVQLQVEFKF